MSEAKQLPPKERDAIIKWPNSYYDRGVKKGIEQGKSTATQEFARKLLQRGMSYAEISDLTGLSEEEIGKLAKEDA